MPAEVASDIKRVNKAYDEGVAAIKSAWFGNEESISGITSMRTPIDKWAERGIAAAKTPTGTPSNGGWPAWVKAGQVFLDGIADIRGMGTRDKLDAITAQARDMPKTTAETAAKGVTKAAKATVAAASLAMDVGGAAATAGAGFLGGLAGATFLVENFVYIAAGVIVYKLVRRKRK